jgi:hypothetical protein
MATFDGLKEAFWRADARSAPERPSPWLDISSWLDLARSSTGSNRPFHSIRRREAGDYRGGIFRPVDAQSSFEATSDDLAHGRTIDRLAIGSTHERIDLSGGSWIPFLVVVVSV